MKNNLGILLMTIAGIAQAGQMLFDFESEADAQLWTRHSNQYHWMTWTEGFATSGKHSLRYQARKYAPGMPEWPSFEVPSPVKDWSGYDRLVLDIANPKLLSPFFAFYISDSKVPVRQALLHKCKIDAFSSQRIVVPLKFPDTVDIKDIHVFHVFTQRPDEDYDFYIDRIMLLRPGEDAGNSPAALQAEVGKARQATVEAWIKELDETLAKYQPKGIPEALRSSFGVAIDEMFAMGKARRDAACAVIRDVTATPEQLAEAVKQVNALPKLYERPLSLLEFADSCVKANQDVSEMLVGVATSMEKILPRDMPVTVKAASELSISLARNEREAAQVVVLPVKGDLQGVSLKVSRMRLEGSWRTFPTRNIDIDTVGYVETKNPPPYTVPYVGWWPDPILDFCKCVDIKQGDAQAFWLRVHAENGQRPGVYRGQVTITAKGVKPFTLPLKITVYDFTLPRQIPLPTAIAWNHPSFEKTAMPQRGGQENWPKMKYVYADFLTDYLVDWGNIYIKTPPDFEVIQYLHDKGHLTTFCLGDASVWDEARIPEQVERFRPLYEEAKRRGLLKYAYIYAFDECQPDKFPIIEKCAKALHEAYPEVLLMTTSYDHSYGADTVVKSIDAWCPLTPRFDTAKVKAAHDANRYVWWYICCGPQSPYANWFVEYPAIEIRQLMGATTAKFQPDGFLYYSMTIWNDNKPIVTGPFTEWNPVSWTTYHGDGCIFAFGKDGRPVPTIRLENYRDGLEDYAYHCILKAAVQKMQSKSNRTAGEDNWLKEATAALEVPEDLVSTTASFSRDPQKLSAWRHRLAQLIESSGFKDLDPWTEADFAVRGWRK